MPEWLRGRIDRTDDCDDNELGSRIEKSGHREKSRRLGYLDRMKLGHCRHLPQGHDEEQDKIEWRCEFCGQRYAFSREQQARLMEDIGGCGTPR